MIGAEVRTPNHEELGTLKEIMIDTTNGKVSYAVLSVKTGLMNFKRKYFAVPWRAINFDNYFENVIILNVTKEKLDNSPGFYKENWPTKANSGLFKLLTEYYNLEEK